MEHENRLGILLISTTIPERLPALSRLSEALGFDEVWLAEDYFFYGGFAGVSQALAGTERIRVGLGVTSCMARHPAVTAMEIASVDRVFPGRFMPGIGHGVPAWVKQMGLYPRSPMRALEEAFTGLRATLTQAEPYSAEGEYFTFRNVRLVHLPARPLPLYLGVIGQRGCELAGRIADGNVLSVLAPTDYVSWARSLALRGMREARRDGHFSLPTYVLTAVDRDRGRARAAVKQGLAFYLAAVGPTALTEVIGINDMLKALLAEGGAEAVLDGMPDEWVDTLAIAGTPEEVAARIEQYWA
ncbi:MAG: LLM class flavin-dependent oxidoreductase, partial [Candidatus Dormibacteraceae bacterium]